MPSFSNLELRELPLSLGFVRERAERFLAACGLRLDALDYFVGLFAGDDDEMLGCGGLKGNVLKCVAVKDGLKGEGLANRIVSQLRAKVKEHGYDNALVFTKPKNEAIFHGLGFRTIGRGEKAMLLESAPRLLEDYTDHLRSLRREGKKGCIVMNANPFTLGHRRLVEAAASEVDWLYLLVVSEDCSAFPLSERLEMVRSGCADIANVVIDETRHYAISAATFPTYFLKEKNAFAPAQIDLDVRIFADVIAPALDVNVRFVGSEPFDALTRDYNAALGRLLPPKGVAVREIPRTDGISASAVRTQPFAKARELVPPTTQPYLLAHAAAGALQAELDTTPKPGLVDRHDAGAHRDMDYALMVRSIRALRPHFADVARWGFAGEEASIAELQRMGREAEADMLAATGGVNTHKGALFALGLCIAAAARLLRKNVSLEAQTLSAEIRALALAFAAPTGTHGAEVRAKGHVLGALENAQTGYAALFGSWLPFLRSCAADEAANVRTFLHILSEIDDTNIIYRKGIDEARRVKQEAADALANFSLDALERLNKSFIERNISPGGAADMLALTILIANILI